MKSVTDNDARAAVRRIAKVCSAVVNRRPTSNGTLTLVEAVKTLDLYLTGKDAQRTSHYGMLRDLDAAGDTAKYGKPMLVYLSDAGSRLLITPRDEPNPIGLVDGDHEGHAAVKEKWERVLKTY